MSTKISSLRRRAIRKRTQDLRSQIDAMDFILDGTLISRTKTCGRPNCRCAKDPSARHGPYHEWSHMENGRLVHSIVTAEQAELIRQAIENNREVQDLIQRWHAETEADILEKPLIDDPKSDDNA